MKILNNLLISLCLILSSSIYNFSQANIEKNKSADSDCKIQLKVEFLASEKIGNITLVSNPCNDKSLEQQAFEAAKNLKFEAKKEDGKKVTVTKTVEFSFTVYDEKAEAILKRAVEKLGGEKYMNVKSQIGKGKFSVLHKGAVVSFQNFVDVIVFPDKERTEFKGGGGKTVQTNFGNTGWIFDGAAEVLNDQSEQQIENFKRGIRVSPDNLLRGYWRDKKAKLEYIGKRPAGLGYRNDVVKLTFEDGFAVEFEFSADGLPMKSIYKRTNADNEEVIEEDRYAQFIDAGGIKTPFIIDHFINKIQSSRINYESVEFNRTISDSIFNKPATAKELKKDLKL